MDIFIYPTTRLYSPDADMLHVRDGVVLLERDGLGTAFLDGLKAVFEDGPSPLPSDEIEARRNWSWKMLDRAARGDVEGNYRRAWLLMWLLENYFLLRGQWYRGSKQALNHLQDSQPRSYALFERALAPGASHMEIEALVCEVSGPRLP